jgi:hypothetical protein
MKEWRGTTALERLRGRYVVNSRGCWEWQGRLTRGGYGSFQFDGRRMNAHRAMYILTRGEVPSHLDLDHLCRNRRCVNPDHLEPVTRSENLRRGDVGGIWQRALTHCPQGHPYDEANTYHRPDRGGRQCRACMQIARDKYNQKNRTAA